VEAVGVVEAHGQRDDGTDPEDGDGCVHQRVRTP
jgi:hypothetical protein